MVSSGIRSSQIFPISFLNQEMLKCSKNSEGTAELEEALATVLDIIKSVNDSMHQIAITGYEVIIAVAALTLSHPMFLSSLIKLCPWLVLCFMEPVPEGYHSVVCCDDQNASQHICHVELRCDCGDIVGQMQDF